MKRLSLLIFSVLFALVGLNAQTVVLEEDFSLVGADSNHSAHNNLDQYTQIHGWTCNWVYTSNEKLRVGKSDAGGFLMTPALDLSGNNGSFTVSFDVKAWPTSNECTKMYVLVVNGTDSVVETVTGLSTNHFQTFTLEFTGGTAETKVKFKSFQDTRARFFIDNIVITSVASGPDTIGPHISSVNPSANVLNVNFNEELDQATAENIANYVLDNNTTVTSATLNGHVVSLGVSPAIVEGNPYTLIVKNVADVTGNVMLPDTITFTYGVLPGFQVSSIAELRSRWTLDLHPDSIHFTSQVYKLTGHAIVTAINNSYRHQVYIQDGTGAIVIDDPDNLFNPDPLEMGEEVTDIYGKLSAYHGILQFAMVQPYNIPSISSFNDVTPLTVTLSQLQDVDFMNQHASQLIRLEDVTFTETGTITNKSIYNVTQNGQTGPAVYIHFWNVDGLSGAPIPTTPVSLVGVSVMNYGKYYLVPRTDKDLITGIPQYLSESDVLVYPNPVRDQLTVTIKTNDFQVTNMTVYDINGKLVSTQPVSDNQIVMNVRSLATGNYFLRLSDGKNSYTTKFVKK